MSDLKSKHITNGVHHVGLTVSNLDEARYFFTNTLGYKQVGEKSDYPAVILSDDKTMITLWQASNPTQIIGFNRKNVIGLHHLALSVDSHLALESLHQELKQDANVKIEFAPEAMGSGTKRHMMCNIPGGGIRIEFIA